MKFASSLFILLCVAFQAFAQFPPRIDDHFWRRKVFSKIDFNEKLNVNLVKVESQLYTKGKYGETNGLVSALLNGFKDGKFLGYRYDSLSSHMTWNDFMNGINKMEGKAPVSGGGGDSGGFEEEEEEFEDEEEEDTGGGETEVTTDGGGGTDDVSGGASRTNMPFMVNMEDVMGLVEDRIFDKNKSDMYYDLQYIVLFYTDPSGTFPEEPVVCFSYKDVMDLLDDTQYKNRSNDAEYRSLREIFELRLFHGFTINLSGYKILDLKESQLRDNQMVEYEHHLWNF